MSVEDTRRILIVDDNPAIHEDFNRILCGVGIGEDLSGLEEELFGISPKHVDHGGQYELVHASQGREAVELVSRKAKEGNPIEVAFVDMRMPPGWDGMETIKRIWDVDPEIRAIICTAYTDHSHEELIRELGVSDKLLILKKPIDVTEVAQLASAMTTMWRLRKRERSHILKLRGHASEKSAEVRDIKDRLEEERRLHSKFEEELADFKRLAKQQEKQWQLLFHALHEPVAILSPTGVILQVNQAFEQLCRVDPELQGDRQWDQVMATVPPLSDFLSRDCDLRESITSRIHVVGSPADLSIKLVPVFDQVGHVDRMIAMLYASDGAAMIDQLFA